MKKTLKKNVVVLLILVPFWAVSQTNKQAIEKYLRASTTTKTTSKTVSKSDFEDWDIQSDGGSTTSGISVAYVVQRYKGIEIFGALTNFNIKNGEVIGVTSNAIRSIASKTNTTKPTISITTALSKAYENLNISAKTTPSLLETLTNNNYKLNSGLAATEPIVGNLVYHQTEDEKLLLAWNFTIPTDDHEHLWSVRIDAVTGVLLEKNDLITHCSFENELINSSNTTAETPSFDITYKQIFTPIKSAANSGTYRAIPYNIESPNHGSRMLITNPANALASPYGWHDNNGVDGAEYTITRGNNVWAKDDFMGTNGTDGSSPDGGSSLTFDFPYPGVTVEAKTYIDAANTNLFYMNNIMHDVWYQYGFDEINGNFQDNNYGRGGKKGDYVLADAQDGSLIATPKLNNANFSTPSDGTSGRMQMYLWNRVPGVRSLQISAPESLVGSYTVNQNVFNPGRVDLPIAPNSIQSDLVLYEDGNGATACVVPTNAAAMKGKIVILRRGGGCSFTVKVKFAQDAGATAVIVVNNAPGELSMAGGDANITIPAMSVAKDLGENMIQKMTSSFVYVILQTPVKGSFVRTDGDFDNGVIAHEYGHGISNRLAGGPNNSSCLTNSDQMGEGWSDWFAMMMQLKPGDVGSSKRGIGTFVSGQGPDGMGCAVNE